MSESTKDWRIGLTVKPKYRWHELKYEQGVIIDVLPDGTGGISDKNGVLKIMMESGRVILEGADSWITS
jgi:hypothetical protein